MEHLHRKHVWWRGRRVDPAGDRCYSRACCKLGSSTAPAVYFNFPAPIHAPCCPYFTNSPPPDSPGLWRALHHGGHRPRCPRPMSADRLGTWRACQALGSCTVHSPELFCSVDLPEVAEQHRHLLMAICNCAHACPETQVGGKISVRWIGKVSILPACLPLHHKIWLACPAK